MESTNRITGATKLIGLIGSPVEHSISPALHNAVFEKMGYDYAYVACNVASESLEQAVRGMAAMGFLGYNVTTPHKTQVLPYLDEVSEAAQIMGAVNTVVVQGGRSLGDNADGAAFMRNLVMNGVNIIGKKITVLGAGGAAAAVVVQAALDGVAEVAMFNRKDEFFERGEALIDRLKGHTDCEVSLHDLANEEELCTSLAESVLVVNATKVGMPECPGCLLSEDMLPEGIIVADMVYFPRETELLAMARAKGNQVIDGAGVFVQQAAIGERLWIGRAMPIDFVMERFFL